MGNPDDAPTSLVRRCLELVRLPLEQMSAEHCRLLLGQKIGVPHIMPLILTFLVDNPMEGGDLYSGALLESVLSLPEQYWQQHPDFWWEMKSILLSVEMLRKEIETLMPRMKALENMDVG